MRNLLIITNSYPNEDNTHYGGIFVKEQVKYLKEYFKEVYVISPQPMGVNRTLQDYEYENVKVFFPRFFHMPVNYFRRRLGDNFFKATLNVIKREKLEFDLVHAHFTWPSGYAAIRVAKKFDIPVVVTLHENREWFLREYTSKDEKIHKTWENANVLIRVNKKDVSLLKKFNHNVYAIPNGFNPQRLPFIDRNAARDVLGIPHEVRVLFSLGNLIERKGFQYLINAMKDVINQRNDVICFIGGGGPLKNKLEKIINKAGLVEHVKLIGKVPDDKLKYWMNAADLFVFPSLSESFGIVVLEALAVGTPVVATTNGGSEEIIISEEYGMLCLPKDPECLAEKILIALEKKWDREKIRNYAGGFTWNKIVKNIITIYTNIREDIENVQY